MTESGIWQCDIEVHPPGWAFPAGASWLAGWIVARNGQPVSDLRAWVDNRVFLALHGLPKPGMDEKFLGRPGPPYSGFVLQVTPHRRAAQLRLEVRDPAGVWTELFRTPITVAADASEPTPPPPLATQLEEMLAALLRRQVSHPHLPLAALADEVVSAAIAVPLDSLPNPPFHGALEEPQATGRVRYGRLGVTGWLSHRTEKIRRLTAVADGVLESPLLHGLARTDIGTVFANLPGGEHAQFVGQADLPPGQGGPVLLKIFAELENGEKHLAFARRFRPGVVAGPGDELPPLSRRTFAQALWALRGSARRHGMDLGATGQLLAAVRMAWAAYQTQAPAPRRHRPAPPVTSKAGPASLRLLVVTHNLNFEGAPRLVFELACYHCRQPGRSVRVLSPQEGPMRRLFEEAGMPVEIVDLSAALRAASPAEFDAALRAAVKTDWSQVDLLIANSLASFWAVRLARAGNRPALLYVHESAPIPRFFGPALSPVLFPLVEEALRTATRVVFTAEASRQVFEPLNDRGHFRVLPSWLDVAVIDTFAATHAKDVLRRKHGLNPAAVVLLNLGTVCERKGQHVFVRAAGLLEAELIRQYPDRPVEFVMVGARPDPFLAMLQLQVADAGLKNVRFIPETRDNFDWLRLADLLVCTSWEESSPRVLLEAAAFGAPIVTTDVNGIPELVTDGEARLIGPGDPLRLAETLRAALADHLAGDRTRSTQARRIVEQRFDERVSLPQHVALANETAASQI